MKASPGSPKIGRAIIGRQVEIDDLWQTLDGNSVLFTAERRVGKSSILEKMKEHPINGWVVLLCDVESSYHPSEMVGTIYQEARNQEVLSRKANWLSRVTRAYEKIAGAEVGGWKLPPVARAWKNLLTNLVEDFTEKGDPRVVIILDEFPHMLSNIIDAGEPMLAAEVLDTMRRLRQRHQAGGQFRFLFTGSIGLHLVISELKDHHGYTGNPTNDLARATLGGMEPQDVELMCKRYLDEESIQRIDPEHFLTTMCCATDSLPLYVEYVCLHFQRANRSSVAPSDITKEVRAMLTDPQVQWFSDAAERIATRYKRLNMDRIAGAVLRLLCQNRSALAESEIVEDLLENGVATSATDIVPVFELLLRDHYLTRKVSRGKRLYKFKYEIMRRWWRLNKE